MIDKRHPEKAEAVIEESVRRLRKSMAAERIYLFGSRARGEANNDSDYDFLVVIHDSPLPRYKREQQAYQSLWGLRVAAVAVQSGDNQSAGSRFEGGRGPTAETSIALNPSLKAGESLASVKSRLARFLNLGSATIEC